ncbi:MAG: hypothetical protein HYW07_09490, partial [Candidatus Latescibacteria bacterium]|nr:hypothetical protein [Candidatus Latescibacterota bacterium]
MSTPADLVLETAADTLRFDTRTGALCSLRPQSAPDQEFIAGPQLPALVIQYLDDRQCFRQWRSTQAEHTQVELIGDEVQMHFNKIAGRDLEAVLRVRGGPDQRFSHWVLWLRNHTGLQITDVQFPLVVAPYQLAGAPGTEAVLWPLNAGTLIQAPKPQDLAPDCPHTWQLRPENSDVIHYPGLVFAQFLAYYNDRAGIYLSCQDNTGRIKLIRPVHCEPGLRLGLAHVGDWPSQGERQLEYEVVLGSFTGDWHAAAELYRDWSHQQPWARQPLHQRRDVPGWLLDSPPHIILRIQGELDIGPTLPNEEFLPYPKMIPLLEKLAGRIEAPLVPVIMSWERPGPWIYPDCFPPAGGEAALKQFCAQARERGWHVGTFCNGTRWVVGHYWSGYDGRDFFAARGGERSVCRTHEGERWKEHWDASWRPSYACCLGVAQTLDLADDFVRRVAGMGLDWIQFLDQNVGCATFPCFAADHGHPPVPGQWMTRQMQRLVADFHTLRDAELARPENPRHLAFSVECPVNEFFLPDFQVCDVRVIPPGHRGHGSGFVPLYHFLYHEFILIQGGFGSAPEPYHLPIRNAYNLVIGQIPGAVMKGDGQLLNLDTMNWAPWDPQVGSDEDAVELLRRTIALRRGPAHDFLVYGRMLAPATVNGIQTLRWQHGGHDHQLPALFHAAWQAPDGRFGLVLA